MRDLHTWLLDGKLAVVVGQKFKHAEAARTQKFISDRKRSGKVILVP